MSAGDTAESVAIVGTGRGGKVLAAHFSLAGYRVRVHDLVEAQVAGIRERGGLEVEGREQRFAPIELATTNLAAALDGAGLIVVCTGGEAQANAASMLAPLLRDGQAILLVQGNTGGSLLVREQFRRAGSTARVDVAEMDNFPIMMQEPTATWVGIMGQKDLLQVAALPATRVEAVLGRFRRAFPWATAAPSVLATGLMNANAILHVAGTVANVGLVEGPDRYSFYGQAVTPSVARLIQAVDRERLGIARALEVRIPDVVEWFDVTYHVHEATLYETIQTMSRGLYSVAPAPKSLGHRYLVEDVTTGLVPMSALGDAAGVETPTIDGLVSVASGLTGRDFWAEGRGLDQLGLSGKSAIEIRAIASGESAGSAP